MTARHDLDARHVGPHVARVVPPVVRHVPDIAHVAVDFARFDAEVPRSSSRTSPAHVALARHDPSGRRVAADLVQVDPDVSYVEPSTAGPRFYSALAPLDLVADTLVARAAAGKGSATSIVNGSASCSSLRTATSKRRTIAASAS